MAQYLGKTVFEDITINEDAESIPYPVILTKTVNNLSLLARHPVLQRELELSAEQIDNLQAQDDERLTVLANEEGTKPGEDFTDFFRRVNREYSDFAVHLTPEQVLALYRWRALWEYVNDYRLPFRRPEFQQYLGLKPSDVEATIGRVIHEYFKSKEYLSKINWASFQRLCKELDQSQSEKMLSLFRNVWSDRL